METIAETALRNQAPLPNQSDCGGRLEARPISQPRCQRMIAERACFSFSAVTRSGSVCRLVPVRDLNAAFFQEEARERGAAPFLLTPIPVNQAFASLRKTH